MGYTNLLINGVYWGYNPLILTFDPNFQRDIQVVAGKSPPLEVVLSTMDHVLNGFESNRPPYFYWDSFHQQFQGTIFFNGRLDLQGPDFAGLSNTGYQLSS